MSGYLLTSRLTALRGRGDDLEAVLLEASQLVDDVDECRVQAVARREREPDVVYVFEVWTDVQTGGELAPGRSGVGDRPAGASNTVLTGPRWAGTSLGPGAVVGVVVTGVEMTGVIGVWSARCSAPLFPASPPDGVGSGGGAR